MSGRVSAVMQGQRGDKGEPGSPGLPGFSGPKGPAVSAACDIFRLEDYSHLTSMTHWVILTHYFNSDSDLQGPPGPAGPEGKQVRSSQDDTDELRDKV